MKWLKHWKTRMLLFVAVLGPSFITANADTAAGGIYTYPLAGAHFGYLLLWTVIPMSFALIVIQEMSARMGAVTGKGLSDLIREEFGLRITFFMMVALVITNFFNVAAEFAGIATSLELFGLRPYYTVPVAAALVWLLVVKGNYKSVEKIFLVASFFYFSYIVAGVLSHPKWDEALLRTLTPPTRAMPWNSDYLYLVVGIIGATIAPWMQFYLQASVVEKGVTERQYGAARIDVFVGSIFAPIVAAFIIVACAATLYLHGFHQINNAADAAQALRPLAGKYAFLLFAGAGVILWPGFPLVKVTVFSQVLNGILLPFVLLFMLRLINKPELMGTHVNSRLENAVSWTTAVVMIVLSIALLWAL